MKCKLTEISKSYQDRVILDRISMISVKTECM